MQKHVENVKSIAQYMGKQILDIEYYDYIYEWLDWYSGKVDTFHKYRVYNGHNRVDKERYSLQMAKVISEDWATLLYNDRTAIKVKDSDQEKLDDILSDNKFEQRFSRFIEHFMALGIGATVVYKDKAGKPKINYVLAPMIFPLKTENGEISDCIFASVVDNGYYLNMHEKQKNGTYKISNHFFRFDVTTNQYYKQEQKEVKESYTSPIKMFQIYKPNICNNIDIFSPFGISVFANSLDRIKSVDLIYDSFKNEFQLGKKRIFIRQDLVDYKPIVTPDGKTLNVPIFDDNDTEFYALPDEENSTGEQIKEVNSTLRVQDHINALQSELNMLSDGCGLGNDRYNFQQGNVYTNTTQVISTQSKLYKTLLKHEKMLRYEMQDLVKCLFYVATNSEYSDDITIDFDDSIIEDSAEIQRRAMLELQSGLIDNVEYFVQVYKYTEEQAQEFVDKMNARKPEEEEEPLPEDEDSDEEPEKQKQEKKVNEDDESN